MHVVFIAPSFPANQKQFVRALAEVGATVTGIGETDFYELPEDVRAWLSWYERVPSVTDEAALLAAVRRVQAQVWVDRLEATIESHMLTVSKVREACGIPGTSYRQTLLCRDKTFMKDFMREHGIPTAASRAVRSAAEVRDFVETHGYPIVLKPKDGAGAAATYRADDDESLQGALDEIGGSGALTIAVEEFVSGHEGFYDTLTVGGEVVYEFISHYYPNVLEAMRTRWVSPVIITTNRVDSPGYDELKALGRKVISALGLQTAPTHMEWFFGDKGLKFSEIGARPPGVGQWDLYSAANDLDLYREWAHAVTYGSAPGHLSRAYSAAIIALRPTQDGVVDHYEGVERIAEKYSDLVIRAHFPEPGSSTQSVEAGYMANAWLQLKHPDFDELRRVLVEIGETVRVVAR